LAGLKRSARAHHGLARSHEAVFDSSQAGPHWQQALALYTDLGIPEADQVRAEIAAADHNDANFGSSKEPHLAATLDQVTNVRAIAHDGDGSVEPVTIPPR
jgi:hypothetical protein